MKSLKEIYIETLSKFTSNLEEIESCFASIEKAHQEEGRFYHNLSHLESLFRELEPIRDVINNHELVNLAIFYHDVVYDAKQFDNEEQSAEYCKEHLSRLRVPCELIDMVYDAIIFTKTHAESRNNDVNLFVDADLAILGSEPEVYKDYSKKIRQEYIIYPDEIFNKGRTQALEQLIGKGKLYITDYFFDLYNAKGLKNLRNELNLLSRRGSE